MTKISWTLSETVEVRADTTGIVSNSLFHQFLRTDHEIIVHKLVLIRHLMELEVPFEDIGRY